MKAHNGLHAKIVLQENGDVRFVESIGESFVYFERIHSGVQTCSEEEAVSAEGA